MRGGGMRGRREMVGGAIWLRESNWPTKHLCLLAVLDRPGRWSCSSIMC